MNTRSKIKRAPKRAHYDEETIYQILDGSYLCHIGFVHENYPVVIPTLYARDGNKLLVHGSAASRMMKDMKSGIDVCITVTKVNGLVLARSAFHHSVNYESVVVFGKAREIVDEDSKNKALKIITEQVVPHRWNEVRKPNQKELKGTTVLEIHIEEVSAKVRTGGPTDDKEDYDLDIWAGVVPITQSYAGPVKDELMRKDLSLPTSVKKLVDQ